MMPSQNVPVQTSQNFPMTFQQPHTIAQQMQTTPSAGYPANPQGTWPVLQKLLTVCVCVCVCIDLIGRELEFSMANIEDHGRVDSV